MSLHSPLLHNSGGSWPFAMNLLKCSLSILSIPEGRLGNIPSGLFHTLCCVSQKHLWHSFIKFKAEGESLKFIFAIFPPLKSKILLPGLWKSGPWIPLYPQLFHIEKLIFLFFPFRNLPNNYQQ